MKVKYILLILLARLTLSCHPEITYDLYKQKQFKEWNGGTSLTYQDFRAKTKPLSLTHPLITAATASGIYYEVQKDSKYIMYGKANMLVVKSYFDPAMSWFDIVHKTPNVLEHEQIHFNITELFTRKLKERLLEKYDKPIDFNQLEEEHKMMSNKMYAYHSEYDQDVRSNRINQKYWLNKVDKELKILEQYQDDVINITSK